MKNYEKLILGVVAVGALLFIMNKRMPMNLDAPLLKTNNTCPSTCEVEKQAYDLTGY